MPAKAKRLKPETLQLRRVRPKVRPLLDELSWVDLGYVLHVDERSIFRWWQGTRRPRGWRRYRLDLVYEIWKLSNAALPLWSLDEYTNGELLAILRTELGDDEEDFRGDA